MTSIPQQAGSRPVAIVTGAGRGIGAHTARRLVRDGWAVLLVDACADDSVLGYPLARPGDLESVVEACCSLEGPGTAAGVIGDVRRQSDLDAAVGEAVARFGGLDAAVAAAGVIAGGMPAWETPEAVWSEMLETNLTGVWRLARSALPMLLARPRPRRGRFVAVSSAAGLRGLPLLAAYAAAKHGVIGLVRSLAAELGGEGITANAVCPGATRTAMLDASAVLYGLADPEEFARHHALGRLVEPGEVAGAVGWLCSEEASAVTGTVIPVDAGMTGSG